MWHRVFTTGLVGVPLLLGSYGASAAQAPTMRDQLRIVTVSSPRFSPDATRIAFVERRADLDSDEYRTEIHVLDIASGKDRALTRERHHASGPAWSPAGDALAFLAPDGDKVLQIFIASMAGGDALQVTHGKESVEQFEWSPDGNTLAFARTDPKPDLKGEDKYRTAFKVGNDDFTLTEAVRPTHVWIVPAAGGDEKRLTEGTWSLPSSLPPGSPSSPIKWSRDGRSLLIVRQETPSTGDQEMTRIQVLDVATRSLRSLTGDSTLEGYPHPSPDGKTVAYWRNRDGDAWKFQDVWVAPFAGGAGRDISRTLDKNVYATRWMPDGTSLLIGANVDTTVGLWKLRLDGSSERLDLGSVMPTNGYWIDADLSRTGDIAFAGETSTDPSELYVLRAGARPQAMTTNNAGLSDLSLGRRETYVWTGPKGQQFDGVLTYPPGYTEGRRYPLVLLIHGGPNSASRLRFGLQAYVMASRGWLVFEPNYRGSDNRSGEFFASIYQDAGQGPGEDVMSGVEALRKRGFVDPSRMAVTGWSYGGFMTTWLAGHYPVWKAAVAGAAVTDWVDMYNLSDGNVTNLYTTGASPYVGDGMAVNRRQSPASFATHITAPTLIMSDTGDFRVPITQSYALYHTLKDNHVTTEFYAIPVGGHSPGDPIRTIDVYERWMKWVEKYLGS